MLVACFTTLERRVVTAFTNGESSGSKEEDVTLVIYGLVTVVTRRLVIVCLHLHEISR